MRILFFDRQWLVRVDGVHRRVGTPQLRAVSDLCGPGNSWGCLYPSVVKDPHRGTYRCWFTSAYRTGALEKNFALMYAESTDGEQFSPAAAAGWLHPELPQRLRQADNLVFWRPPFTFGVDVSHDPFDRDPARRFKLAYTVGRDGVHATDFVHGLAFSPDGVVWAADPRHRFIAPGRASDTVHYVRHNAASGRYQMVVRPAAMDRRVALIESADLIDWSAPRVVLAPDASDPPGTQFYAMPVFPYAGMWVGLLWVMTTPPTRFPAATGPMSVYLAWSYDGRLWHRERDVPFMAVRPAGEYGHGAVEACSWVVGANDIRIYASGFLVDHAALWDLQEQGISPSQLLCYRLRPDGFCSLHAGPDGGEVATLPLFSPHECPTLNCRLRGSLTAALLGPDGRPLAGRGFEHSVPVSGDHLAQPLRWTVAAPDGPAGGRYGLALRWQDGEVFGVGCDG